METPQAVRRTRRPTPALMVMCLLLMEVIPTLTAATAAKPPAPIITILTITPEGHQRVFAGDTLTISATVTAADPSVVEYQFFLDDTIIQSWSSASSCQRVMALDDRGLHTVWVQVRDPNGQAQQETSVYVIRKPISPPSHEPIAQTRR